MMKQGIRFTRRFWLAYALAWTPYALSYGAVFLTQSAPDYLTLIISICRNIIPAALLGLGVIWLCGRIDWSRHRRFWFFPFHMLAACVYSGLWMLILFTLFTISQYRATGTWNFIYFTDNALQWQIFTGIMIYATIASISYVVQVVENLREEERRAARAETLYAQNALAALQAQLNPHFLFNTLHTLMALVRYHPEKAEHALEKLAEMLRYTLRDKRASKQHLVRLTDELSFVENYLELEKLRLGERLTFTKQVAPETLELLLPAFTVQPLVENSIKHGIAPKNVPATVFISAKKENGHLLIEIGDDGIGAREVGFAESGGLGIGLVREQLQIQYGAEADFKISTNPHEGFKTNIKLPAQYAETKHLKNG